MGGGGDDAEDVVFWAWERLDVECGCRRECDDDEDGFGRRLRSSVTPSIRPADPFHSSVASSQSSTTTWEGSFSSPTILKGKSTVNPGSLTR